MGRARGAYLELDTFLGKLGGCAHNNNNMWMVVLIININDFFIYLFKCTEAETDRLGVIVDMIGTYGCEIVNHL